MYYPDLSLYEYAVYFGMDNPMPLPNVFNIGWLEYGHEFPQGDVDQPTLDTLKRLLEDQRYNCIGFRGYHYCDLCDVSDLSGPDRANHARGSSNVLIPSSSGKIYAAPFLIYHYIVEHHYRPPEEFLEAVRQYDPDLEWDGYAVYRGLVEKRWAELGKPPEKP
jgi:hypothetical protein